MVMKQYGVSAKFNTKFPTYENLQEIAQLIADGEVRAKIDHVYPIREVQSAHRQSESRHGQGRILLDLNSKEWDWQS